MLIYLELLCVNGNKFLDKLFFFGTFAVVKRLARRIENPGKGGSGEKAKQRAAARIVL